MRLFCTKLAFTMILSSFVAVTHADMYGMGKLNVSRSVVVNHDPGVVWETAGGFFALDEWHPAVADVLVKEGGMVRILILGNGAEVHERLLEYKDRNSYTYSIFKGPWPITDYVSTVGIEPFGNGATRVTWSSTFNARDADRMIDTFNGVYDAGLQNLAKMMNQP